MIGCAQLPFLVLTCLFIFKADRGDTEGIVVDVASDSSITIKLYVHILEKIEIVLTPYYERTNDILASIPHQNIELNVRPHIGDIVTFESDGYSLKGAPVNPKVFRIRTDLSWEDVLLQSAMQTARPQNLSGITQNWTSPPLY